MCEAKDFREYKSKKIDTQTILAIIALFVLLLIACNEIFNLPVNL